MGVGWNCPNKPAYASYYPPATPITVTHSVVVQIADDPDFKENVRTLFNNDYLNKCGLGKGRDKEYNESYEGKLIEAKGAVARYVRLYSAGCVDYSKRRSSPPPNHYWRVDVYGLAR